MLLVALALAACGSSAVVNAPTPTAIVAASVSASSSAAPTASPQRVSGSAVRITVNGVDQPAGGVIAGPLSGPLTVRVTFPFDIDRSAFERFLPREVTPAWRDDRTVDLTVPQGTNAFKAVEVPARDGSSVIDIFFVNVMFPPSRVVNVYTLADLASARPPVPSAPATPTASITSRIHLPARMTIGYGLALSRDAKSVLVYGGAQTSDVQLVDVETDSARTLAPPASDGPFVFGDWLADGRLLLVGKKAWVGSHDGSGMRVLVDTTSADGAPDSVAVSFDGSVAALSYRGRVMLLDLLTARLAAAPDSFRPCDGSNGVVMTWSLDAKRLAGADCAPGADPDTAHVKILDLPSRRVVATIGGGARSLSTLSTGELLVVGPSGISGEGAPSTGRVMTFDGTERRRYTGGAWQLSADARYLLQMEPVGGAGADAGTAYTLIDLGTNARSLLFLPWGSRWLPDGRLAGL